MKADPSFVCVATRIKELQKELSDAEWENSPNLAILQHELAHFTKLVSQGILVEPNF